MKLSAIIACLASAGLVQSVSLAVQIFTDANGKGDNVALALDPTKCRTVPAKFNDKISSWRFAGVGGKNPNGYFCYWFRDAGCKGDVEVYYPLYNGFFEGTIRNGQNDKYSSVFCGSN